MVQKLLVIILYSFLCSIYSVGVGVSGFTDKIFNEDVPK